MATKKTTIPDWRERPPLGSDEAINSLKEVLLSAEDIWDQLHRWRLTDWPGLLYCCDRIHFPGHYLELIEAFRELGWGQISGPLTDTPEDITNPEVHKKWPEDFFKEYVAEVRREEMIQRRKMAAHRRRKAI